MTKEEAAEPVAWLCRLQTIGGTMSDWWPQKDKHTGLYPNGRAIEGFEQQPLFAADDPSLWRFWNDKAREQAATITALRQQLAEAQEALSPFAACCFADNGDITINSGRLCAGDFLRAAMLTSFEQRERGRIFGASTLPHESDTKPHTSKNT